MAKVDAVSTAHYCWCQWRS